MKSNIVDSEKWKAIDGYNGKYEVSNLGNIRSMYRYIGCHGSSIRVDSVRYMATTNNGHGYRYVSLSIDGKKKNHYIHRLVADAFVPNPDNKPNVNHLDYDITNNSASNLQWCTHKSKTGHKYVYHLNNGNKKYRVYIKQLKAYKEFNSLDEALEYRNEVMKGWGYEVV